MELIWHTSPTVTIATNMFVNVPVILKYENTPLLEIIKHQDIGFTSHIPIYASDGTYLAKVKGNRIYPTEAGKKSNLEIRNPQGKVVCTLDKKVLFELSHGVGDGFKAEAELYTPDGYFVKCSEQPKLELFDISGNSIKIGGIIMSGNYFQNLSVGIWLRKDGSCAIGVG